jgi:phosphoribosylformylglycinamidine synthase
VVFDATYRGNPLVNVLCLGVLPTERLVLGRHRAWAIWRCCSARRRARRHRGVSVLASAGFGEGDADADKRPSVQVVIPSKKSG